MRYLIAAICALVVYCMLPSCAKDYSVTLPANESQLAVECYLEDGQPLRALVTETTGLLDTSLIPPVILDATVIISYAGRTDTLQPFIYIDSPRNRVYNYGSSTIVRADYSSGERYRIDVIDRKGRHAWGTTGFIKPVAITGLNPIFNALGEASCVTTFADDRSVKNYYRLVLKRNAQYDSIQQNRLFNDDFANNAGDIVVRSGYRYASGDSIHATLFHLDHEYYQYLNTTQNARSALVNPFAASGEVISNISGGVGVFAALSYTERSIQVP